MDFEQRKAAAMAALSDPSPDKSPKGNLDAPIVPLLLALNNHPSFFTTSSCSGRITILSHPTPDPKNEGISSVGSSATENSVVKGKKKKAGGGGWLLVTHDPADPESVVDLLFRRDHSNGVAKGGGSLVFRFEPLIIAVECRGAAAAQTLVSTAISCGFRESGMTSLHKRIMIAIRCSIRLEVPLGDVNQKMVSPDYVKYLVGIANEKMEANKERTERFFAVLLQQVLSKPIATEDGNSTKSSQVYNTKSFLDPKVRRKDRLCKKLGNDNDRIYNGVARQNGIDYGTKQTVAFKQDEVLHVTDNSQNNESKAECNDARDNEADYPSGFCGEQQCRLHGIMMEIVGEPVERLFLWGQSTCTINYRDENWILIFGGFGGVGRHARRNDFMMLEPQSGLLKVIDAEGPPSPRLGHTSSVIGDTFFVIGGRGGPTDILNDVWAFDMTASSWRLLECTGSIFHPRHRHAAAVVGTNIYVFGGLNNEVIYSSMHVFDTKTLQWSQINSGGECPSARHSHSLTAYGSYLLMFGGFDGERALNDLYSFNVETLRWKNEKTAGRSPFPRFSHSSFIYDNYLGILGGCPLRQEHQEISLLDVRHYVWKHIKVDSMSRELWIRSSANVVGDNLLIVGGGTSCYAFGTKFNPTTKFHLHTMTTKGAFPSGNEDWPIRSCKKTVDNKDDPIFCSYNAAQVTGRKESLISNLEQTPSNNNYFSTNNMAEGDGQYMEPKHLVLLLEKKYAKIGKDTLKRFGSLDLERKVVSSQEGSHIHLPVTHALLEEMILCSSEDSYILDGCYSPESSPTIDCTANEISLHQAVHLFLAWGGSIVSDDKPRIRKVPKAPQKLMRDAVVSLIIAKGMSRQLLEQLPTRWEHLGDIVVLPVTCFRDPSWDSIAGELWPAVAKSLGACRLARQGRVLSTGTRDSTLEILVGDNGWVAHHENGITYSFDSTKCMFSKGNLSEKLRMARLDCSNEVIVDLFAGIGYFVLPFLVKSNAKLVYACEWNPHAVQALKHNIKANAVDDRCVILEGDNRATAPKQVADRVCLGLLPSSETSWATAVRALKDDGGILHVHGNVKDSDEQAWSEYVVKSINNIVKSEGRCWDVSLKHLERVKWYGPHIRHLVADIRCEKLC